MPEQQVVEIAKAIGRRRADPDHGRADGLAERARSARPVRRHRARCAREGAGIIYISHRLEEVLAIADRVTVLRDGETVGTWPARDVDRAELIRLMVGRELAAVFPKRRSPRGDVALELRGVSQRATGVHDVSLSRRARRDPGPRRAWSDRDARSWPRSCSASRRPTPARSGSPACRGGIDLARRRDRGRASRMCPRIGGGTASCSRCRSRPTRAWPTSRAVSSGGLIRIARRNGARAAPTSKDFASRRRRSRPKCCALSGGNQQKVALARWLATQPSRARSSTSRRRAWTSDRRRRFTR